MRSGLAVSVFGHAALLAWGLLSLPSPKPLDASTIEAIPVNFVKLADVTSIPKGIETPKPVEKPKPVPPKAVEEKPQPKPEPTPPPEPKPEPAPVAPPPPAPPEPTPPKAEPKPEPTPPPHNPPEPTPPKAEPKPEPTPPPEKTQPEPAPKPEPAAKPEPKPPETPPPAPEKPAPKPPEPTVKIQPKPDNVPMPVLRPSVAAPAPKQPSDTFNADKIAALLNKDTPPAEAQKQEPTTGGTTTAIDAKMTVTELDALRARLAECWSPPIGWTDPKEVRVVVMLSLNPDGTLNGDPTVLERPAGRYEQAAPESVLRAVRRCAPYSLPPDKYASWKQVKVTFDPVDMGGG